MESSDQGRPAVEQSKMAQLEARIQAAQLTPDDQPWLEVIVPSERQPLTPEWMNIANTLIRAGAPELPRARRPLTLEKQLVVGARAHLLEFLGLEEIRMVLEEADVSISTLVSPLTVVPLCRIFHQYGISFLSTELFITASRMDPEIVEQKVQTFNATGVEAAAVLPGKPHLLSQAEKIGRLCRIADALRWQGSKEELVGGLLSGNNSKISRSFFLAHLAANHLSPEDRSLSVKVINSVTYLPPEVHLLAIAEHGLYHPRRAVQSCKEAAGKDSRKILLNLIKIAEVRKRIGVPTLRAYFRHKPLTDEEGRYHYGIEGSTLKQLIMSEDSFRQL